MPTYTFYDTRKPFSDATTETHFMTISEMEKYLKDNIMMALIPSAPAIGDSIRLGITKPPADFQKHIMGRIKSNTKGKNMMNDTKFNIPKEI